jgi:hypothetical protein
MNRTLAAALALCLAPAAKGQDLTPEDFQIRTEGHAFRTYYADGVLQGIEIFLRDRNVIWQPADGACRKGIWQVQDGHVCYLYEGTDPGYCLTYRADGDEIVGTTDEGEVFILRQGSKDEVTCPTDEPLLSLYGDQDRPIPVLGVTLAPKP